MIPKTKKKKEKKILLFFGALVPLIADSQSFFCVYVSPFAPRSCLVCLAGCVIIGMRALFHPPTCPPPCHCFFLFCFFFLSGILSRSACLSLSLAPGLTPALACAPSREVADCLALILATMMPLCSPCSSGAPSPGALLRSLPRQAKVPKGPRGPSSEGTTTENDSDSETFWRLLCLESSLYKFSKHLTSQKLYKMTSEFMHRGAL